MQIRIKQWKVHPEPHTQCSYSSICISFLFKSHRFLLYFFTLRESFSAVVPLCAEMITTRSNFVFQTKRGPFLSTFSNSNTPPPVLTIFSRCPTTTRTEWHFLLYRALLFIQGPALSNSFKTFFAFKLARSQNGNNPLCGRDISYTFPLDKIGGFRAIRCPLNVSLMKLMSVKCLINVA